MRNSFLALLGATLMVAAMAQPALSATPPASLAGEQFASTTTPFPPGFGGSATVISKTCGPDGTGSLTFTADGNATGPYPGTFHEDGTIDLVGGHVTRADATFTILSAAGAVSGSKSFNTSANPADSAGNCSVEPSTSDPNNFLNFQAQQQQTYTATITNAQGQFGDSGTGGSVFQTSFQGTNLTPQFQNTFTEGFQVSNGVTGKVSPTVTTQATPSVNTHGFFSDTATLSGGNAPNGTITFDVFEPSNDTCTGFPIFESIVPVSGNGIYTSDLFPAVIVGIYRWLVVYNGDPKNNSFTTVCNDPAEITTVTLTSPTITTSATTPATTPGPISDTATLAGGFAPTGTITFSLFGVGDATCAGTPLQSVKDVNANGAYTSDPFPAAVPGTYRWIASYSGNGDNNPATTACNDSGEISEVSKTTPTITTRAIASVTIGDKISDTATLAGGNAPSGNILFHLFSPDDPTCARSYLDFFATVSFGNNSYTSTPIRVPLPGTYHWIATYLGDQNNNAVSTACGDAGETSIVKANPTITTQAPASAVMGGTISDTATLDGGVTPTGTITFTLFGTADCLGTVLFSSTASVDGNGPGYDSAPFFPPAPGTYSWVAAYSGDGNNNVATTACGEAGEISTVTKASPHHQHPGHRLGAYGRLDL